MYKVKLTKTSDNVNELRTKEIVGYAPKLPETGYSFIMFSQALETQDPLAVRHIHTSPVAVISVGSENGTVVFRTVNSEYKLEIL